MKDSMRDMDDLLRAANARIAEIEAEVLNTSQAVFDVAKERDELTAHCERLRESLEQIKEYWNGDINDIAMIDALNHIDDICIEALSATPAQSRAKDRAETLREAAENFKPVCECGVPCDCYSPLTAKFQLRRMADDLESGEKKHDL